MANKRKRLLPLGSVVKLLDDEVFMIMGYKILDKNTNSICDYLGCDANYGMIYNCKAFNNDDVKEVEFRGFETPTIMKVNEMIRNEGNENE